MSICSWMKVTGIHNLVFILRNDELLKIDQMQYHANLSGLHRLKVRVHTRK